MHFLGCNSYIKCAKVLILFIFVSVFYITKCLSTVIATFSPLIADWLQGCCAVPSEPLLISPNYTAKTYVQTLFFSTQTQSKYLANIHKIVCLGVDFYFQRCFSGITECNSVQNVLTLHYFTFSFTP